MIPSAPAVSILMPVYNGERYLREALDDLLRQTFTEFELIAVDDGSGDGTPQLLTDYAARDSRMTVLRNETNLGLPRTLNRGLDHCRSPLVARADADDRYHPDRLRRQVEFLEAHPEVGLLSCASQRMDPEGNWLGVARFPTKDGHIRMRELFVNSFSHPGAVFRTDLVQRLGGYDPTFTVSEDADLWARLRKHTRAANLPDALVYYRVLPDSLMRSKAAERDRTGPIVRQRLLSEYLERSVGLDEARAMVATFHPRIRRLAAPGQLRAGVRGLREVLDKAHHREDADTVRYFRREVALALLKHSNLRRHEDRRASWMLLLVALRWWPPFAVTRPGVGQLVRCTRATASRAPR